MFRFIVLFCLFGASSVVPKFIVPPLDGRIVGGKSTTIEEFPHQVSLQYEGSHQCGGSIIGKRVILTAAHCVDGLHPEDITILVGSTSKTKGGQIFKVKKILVHEDFDAMTTENDIAILILMKGLKFGDSVQPIQLSGNGEEAADGSVALVSGWGMLTEGDLEGPDNLQFVEVEVVNTKKCADAYRSIEGEITENMLCAGAEEGGRDACQQDSGGPLIMKNKLIGVVSWGFGCARVGYPGVYTKVSAYRNWISKTSREGLL